MTLRRTLLLASVAAVAAVGASAAWRGYARDLRQARARLQGRSTVFQSRFGDMEYAEAGEGPPCIMIHGTGGGFDQGLLFARRLIASRRIIAPSRFGYLRSAQPGDPSLENQADAVLDLMDHLNIARAPVVGGSAGALTALAFAIRHPERCSALVALVPATYVPGRRSSPPGPLAAAIMQYGLRSDVLFWLGETLARDTMIRTLLATDPALVHRASPEERARVGGILASIQPVSLRADGLANDAAQAGAPPPMELDRIQAPTLAISCEDDRFGTADAARHIAASVPGARLTIYPDGGHVWVGRDAEVWAAIDEFLPRD